MSNANVSATVPAKSLWGWKRWALVVAIVALIAGGGTAWAVVAQRNAAVVEAWTSAAAGLADQMTASQAVVDEVGTMLRVAEGIGVDGGDVDATALVGLMDDARVTHPALTEAPQSDPQSGTQSDAQSGGQSGAQSGGGERTVFVVDEAARPPVGEMPAATTMMGDATSDLEEATMIVEDHVEVLRPVVDARVSELQTDLEDVRSDLEGVIVDAQKTLTDSKGKVAKKATRDDLATAIEGGQARLDVLPATDSIPPADLERRTQSLTAGIEQLHKRVAAVEKSIAAKEKADEEAAAAEAAAQTQASSVGEYSDDSTAWTGSSNDAGSWSGSTTTGDDYVAQSDECIPGTQCYVYDDDGWEHHQIHPDSDGNYTDDIGKIG